MQLERIKRLRCNLTLHFAVLAWLTAMLVASGSGSFFLPILIFFVSTCGFIFVDSLEWFEIGRIGSYIAMSLATCFAVGGYIYSVFVIESETGQLASVAGLLIYPECVLFLQRKSLRIYEQLAIFLLLEMIVAALINDNLLFGILLIPIMLLWVSSLFIFSRYATLVGLEPSVDKPIPILVEVLYKKFVKPMFGTSTKRPIVTTSFVASVEVQSGNFLRRALQTLPIGIGAIVFAAVFFYLLPRTSPGSFRAGLGVSVTTGLPDAMRMGVFGRLLQDPTPVMRVTLKSRETGQTYKMLQPPYLRARVFDVYGGGSSSRDPRYTWRGTRANNFVFPPLEGIEAISTFASRKTDLVVAEFDIHRKFASTLYSIPPAFATTKKQSFQLSLDTFRMLLAPIESTHEAIGKSFVYEIGSAGFYQNQQLPIVPANFPRVEKTQLIRQLLVPVIGFNAAEPYRQEILRQGNCPETDVYRAAKCYENHFIFSGDFSYSLDLRPPSDPGLDPVEDFIVNQRRGHCQYFAAAMVAMLRRNGVPSRMVGGYRPTEFNSYGYFAVRQSDAHAWAEGLFTHEQLENTELARWLSPEHQFYWVRFDPTPSSDGGTVGIVEQRGQAIDFAQKLWKDYVVDAQKLSGENSIYAPVSEDSEGAYYNFIERMKQTAKKLREGTLLSEGQGIDFALPLMVAFLCLAGIILAGWRLLVILPRWAPNLAKRLGIKQPNRRQVQQAFYARCLSLLEERGFSRPHSQTPKEFTSEAASEMAKRGQDVEQSLDVLTKLYYQLRFGPAAGLTDDESRRIDSALRQLESQPSASH